MVWFVGIAKRGSLLSWLSPFKNPVFLAAIMAGFIYNFGNAVVFLQLTNLWQYVTGLKTLEVSPGNFRS